MADLKAKQEALAEILEGRVVDDTDRVAVCVKGATLGFPATMEAFSAGWPFGVTYTVETRIAVDEAAESQEEEQKQSVTITMYPRVGRGLWGLATRLLLFESKGQAIGDKRLEKVLNFSFDNSLLAERLIHYPGVADRILFLEETSKFSELIIKSDRGIVLAQPKSFTALDLDVARATFKALGEIGQVLFEAF